MLNPSIMRHGSTLTVPDLWDAMTLTRRSSATMSILRRALFRFARWPFLIGAIGVAVCLLGVASPIQRAANEHFPDATEVFQCKFDAAADANQVGWPDRWTRERGAGYPRYLEVRIDPAAPPQSTGQSLRMNLDGGAAAAYSPPIAVQAAYSYVLECQVRTEGVGTRSSVHVGHVLRRSKQSFGAAGFQ